MENQVMQQNLNQHPTQISLPLHNTIPVLPQMQVPTQQYMPQIPQSQPQAEVAQFQPPLQQSEQLSQTVQLGQIPQAYQPSPQPAQALPQAYQQVQPTPQAYQPSPQQAQPLPQAYQSVQPVQVMTQPVQEVQVMVQPVTKPVVQEGPQPDDVAMDKNLVTYLNYSPKRLAHLPFTTEIVPMKDGAAKEEKDQNYYQIPLKYNYGTISNKKDNDILFEGCELTTKYGISIKPAFGKIQSSLSVRFDPQNRDHNMLLSTFDSIYWGAAQLVDFYKDKVTMDNFIIDTPRFAEATGFKIIYTKKKDAPTALHIKLQNFSNAEYTIRSLFYNTNGEVIDWKHLENKSFSFVPLFRIKNIYCGGKKAAIQMDLKSAVVTSEPVANVYQSLQTDTMKRYADKNPDLANTIAASISRNTMNNQDQLMGASMYVPEKTAVPQASVIPIPNTSTVQPNMEGFVSSVQPRMPVPSETWG